MRKNILCLLLPAIVFNGAVCLKIINDNNRKSETYAAHVLDEMQSKYFWSEEAQRTLRAKLMQSENKNVAKNVIFFVGDGMSLSTVTASRILEGQQKHAVGERNQLFFERFPHVGLSKTYCVDRQVSDSACTATAYLCGIKSRYATLGLTPNVKLGDCEAAMEPQNQLESIADWALQAGKAAGLVTTTTVTNASPAAAYAHSANREFESDFIVNQKKADLELCVDIARQLIENEGAKGLQVILGGGLTKFLPNNTKFASGLYGERLDGRNLVREWKESKPGNATFVYNRKQLLNTDWRDTDFLLGLFAPGHTKFHVDSDDKQPQLDEMTAAAINILQKNNTGFFLFVEGGLIDHGHHMTQARKALDETMQFSRAIQTAYEMTDPEDTLIVVTADHGHTMTISGQADINNPITGLSSKNNEVDSLPRSTLSYADGQGFKKFYSAPLAGEVHRVDLNTLPDFDNANFLYPAAVPAVLESHDGTDVPIYASGPWSHLFTGVLEQNTLPALMGFAACIGPGQHTCT